MGAPEQKLPCTAVRLAACAEGACSKIALVIHHTAKDWAFLWDFSHQALWLRKTAPSPSSPDRVDRLEDREAAAARGKAGKTISGAARR